MGRRAGASTTGAYDLLPRPHALQLRPQALAYKGGEVPTVFVHRLLEHCAAAIRRTQGFHVCDICLAAGEPWRPTRVMYQGRELLLGSAEVWVGGLPGQPRLWYAAPDLVYHYVTGHEYRPPDAFIEAVLHGQRLRRPSRGSD
ncbi:MAG: hypothetical protein M3252_03170 [Actinomycetota bacterium]|nr:hypothetical protein [Actinomycetota bacterium]